MKNKKFFNLMYVILCLLILSGCSKENNNTNFEKDVVLNNITIDEVKLSEINTINDILNKFKGSQILDVSVCYEEENNCPSYSYEEFLTDKVSKVGASSVSLGIFVPTEQKSLMIIFSTYYDVYEEKQNDSIYYSLDLLESPGTIKLDGAYIELLPMSDIQDKYDIEDRSTDNIYYIDFENKTGDKYSLTGYLNKSHIQLFNISERDRNIK